jgi:hypothetical protein
MCEKALLRRLVVIGRDDQDRIGASLFGMLGKLDGFAGVVGAGARHHGNALGCCLDTEFHDTLVFGMRQRWRFACRPDGNEAAAAFLDLPIDMRDESRFIDEAGIREGGDECGNGSLEHAELLTTAIHASAAFLEYEERTIVRRKRSDKRTELRCNKFR